MLRVTLRDMLHANPALAARFPGRAEAATVARTPNSAASMSRRTYSGGTSSETPGTRIASCTPSSVHSGKRAACGQAVAASSGSVLASSSRTSVVFWMWVASAAVALPASWARTALRMARCSAAMSRSE